MMAIGGWDRAESANFGRAPRQCHLVLTGEDLAPSKWAAGRTTGRRRKFNGHWPVARQVGRTNVATRRTTISRASSGRNPSVSSLFADPETRTCHPAGRSGASVSLLISVNVAFCARHHVRRRCLLLRSRRMTSAAQFAAHTYAL
uniref:Uncharacterized protein n=1 Tax=Plectus sambesii TaxID=2011161 RepID=A0A914WDM2_9BILA